MRRIAALALTFTLALAFPAVAGGPDNIVDASPTADGAKIYRSGVMGISNGTDSVTNGNLAFAHPEGCTGCEGVAAAYQAVIVTGNPTTVAPENAAIAINTDCTSCRAFAYAYQYVVSADRGTELSKRGQGKLKGIGRQADRLVRSGLSDADLQTALEALAAKFKAAVVEDLQRSARHPHGGENHVDVNEGQG
jgi:hypothetical protein